MSRDRHDNIKPSLHLPRDLKNRILADHRLSLHQKFVLFTLYYLDSKGRLSQYRTYVPRFLNLGEEEFASDIDALVQHKYLSLEKEGVSLNIKPLRYHTLQ